MVTILEAQRIELGLSRAELAKRAGVARDTVRLVEEGKCRPRVATARKIAGALGLQARDVLSAAAAGEGKSA